MSEGAKVLKQFSIALVAFFLLGTTNPPSPNANRNTTNQQSGAVFTHQNSTTLQTTLQSTALVKKSQIKGDLPRDVKAPRESRWYCSPDWLTAIFTGILAAATIGLWFFTALMWRATTRAIKDGEKSIQAATAAADEMKHVAQAMAKQATIAHQNYLATHRPRIRIRRITVTQMDAGQPVQAEIIAANIGVTNARMAEIGFDIFTRHSPYHSGFAFDARPKPIPSGQIVLPPGQEAHINVVSTQTLSSNDILTITQGNGLSLATLGIIYYVDDMGTGRSTSFARLYDRRINRFMPPPPDDPQADRDFED